MSDKRNDSRNAEFIADTVRDNTLKVFDEAAKAQPLYAQSASNLQLDYFQTVKNAINTYFAANKQLANALNIPQQPEVSEQISRQSTEMTNNTIRSIGIYQQLTNNALDAARENLKIYNKTVNAVTDFSTNVMRAWTMWSQQQAQQAQQAFRA